MRLCLFLLPLLFANLSVAQLICETRILDNAELPFMISIYNLMQAYPVDSQIKWRTVPTTTTSCCYDGISCNSMGRITDVLTDAFFIDFNPQTQGLDLTGISDGGTVRWDLLDVLNIIVLFWGDGSTGTIPVKDLKKPTIGLFTSYGGVGSQVVFADNADFNDLMERVTVNLRLLEHPSIDNVRTPGSCYKGFLVVLENVPKLDEGNVVCATIAILLRVNNVGWAGLTEASWCADRQETFISNSPNFRGPVPLCVRGLCTQTTVPVKIIAQNNDICILNQPPSSDVAIDLDQQTSDSVIVSVNGNGYFQSPSPAVVCAVTRDANRCIDCFNDEIVAGPIAKLDICNVCDGDGESCRDCDRLPFGTNEYDICDICGGDGTSCLDCEGLAFGTSSYDQCGVCGGDGTSCLDCSGVLFGTLRYDACGVCDGSFDCFDCAGVKDGTSVVDQCGVCNGSNACQPCKDAHKDKCGVCNGDDSSCTDCAGRVFGTAVYDACDVCNGDNSACTDCKGVLFGTTPTDACGVCEGDGSSCTDCFGVVGGTALYDVCGVCNGAGECADCAGTPNGIADYDVCDVCDGDGTSCLDCAGTPFGTKLLNKCHQCTEAAEHDLADNCVESLLAEMLHSDLATFGWIAVGVAVLAFIIALCCARACGAALFVACCGLCFRRRAPAAAKAEPQTCADKKTNRSRLASNVSWDKAGQPLLADDSLRHRGGGAAPTIPSIYVVVLLALLALPCASALTPSETLYVEVCRETNLGALVPAFCDEAVADACTKWRMGASSVAECYDDGTGFVRSFSFADVELLASSVSGTITQLAVEQLRHAQQIVIFGSVAPSLSLAAFGQIDFLLYNNLEIFWLNNVDVGGAQLPPSVSFATKLRILKLINTGVTGVVGPLLCTSPRLEQLVLRGGALSGNPFCQPIPLFTNMRIIDFRNNAFTGAIPSLALLQNLRELYLDNNGFSSFATSDDFVLVSNFPANIEVICLAYNKLDGYLLLPQPARWRNDFVRLREFYIDGNNLGEQPLPALGIGLPDVFTGLGVSFNRFQGPVPAAYFADGRVYKTFRVNNNQLTGPYPPLVSEQLCGECSWECNLYCDAVPDIHPDALEVSRCSYSLELDLCLNVCANLDCLDCAGVRNGPHEYDECDVCSDVQTTGCFDCAGVPNGPATYDACDVCDGDDSTCRDCAGTVNGPLCYDACDVCGGDNSACADCHGAPHGSSVYDQCDVCGGNDSTCTDCAGTLFGTAKFDEFGVCDGGGASLVGPLQMDLADAGGATAWLVAALLGTVVALCCIAFALTLICGGFRGAIDKINNPRAR